VEKKKRTRKDRVPQNGRTFDAHARVKKNIERTWLTGRRGLTYPPPFGNTPTREVKAARSSTKQLLCRGTCSKSKNIWKQGGGEVHIRSKRCSLGGGEKDIQTQGVKSMERNGKNIHRKAGLMGEGGVIHILGELRKHSRDTA